MKRRFHHPRVLPKTCGERMPPLEGDETFRNGLFLYNITALLSWLEQNPQPIVDKPVRIWSTFDKEPCYVDMADITRPIIIAEIAPDYRDFLPDFPENDWYGRGYTCIDGQHRLEKARRLGLETLPAVILRMEQVVPFMYAGYKMYADYWNGKLRNRIADARWAIR